MVGGEFITLRVVVMCMAGKPDDYNPYVDELQKRAPDPPESPLKRIEDENPNNAFGDMAQTLRELDAELLELERRVESLRND